MSKKKVILILMISLIVIALGVTGIIYYRGVSKYKDRFMKGIFINGIDCTDMEPGAVCAILDSQISNYVLEVSGRDPKEPEKSVVIGTITPGDISMRRKDTEILVKEIFAKQNPYKWYQMLWEEKKDYKLEQEITFEQDMLSACVNGWDACAKATTVAPQNAYVSEYLPEENAYQVIPDTIGSEMDAAKVLPAIEKALYSMENQVDIEGTGCYNSAEVKADDEKLNAIVGEINSWLGSCIRYDWYGTELVVDVGLLKDWVSLQDGKPVLDEEAVAQFVQDAKKAYDPYGHKYTFRTTLGVDLKLKCKSGWTTDPEKETEELIALIKQGAVTERRPVSKTENYVFFDGTVGDSYAEVDLSNQHMYFYYKGELYLETDFVSGDVASGHATPEGIFAVTYKQRDRILRGPDYESFVHYWMPFYGGYGMHDAMWRRVFGGTIFLDNGSHGCVNLPLKNAKTIYECVETGFPVVCYYYPEGKNPKENAAIPTGGNAQAGDQGQGTSNENGEAPEGESLTEDNDIHGQF